MIGAKSFAFERLWILCFVFDRIGEFGKEHLTREAQRGRGRASGRTLTSASKRVL